MKFGWRNKMAGDTGVLGGPIPTQDGAVNEYVSPEARASPYFNAARKVIFINGMLNSGESHATLATALSLLQMCTVIGVFNLSDGFWQDIKQSFADKDQFDGPLSFSAITKVKIGSLVGRMPVDVALRALSRNPAQTALFEELRKPESRKREIFAHSQGNLILSNVLQAIAAVDGPAAVQGRVVYTFGSPALNWPPGLVKYECGFTFDPVTWLAGLDFSISKVSTSMGQGSFNPLTHSFLEYLKNDPAFVVNRFRWGGLGMTFYLDDDGLAKALAGMGTNMDRVRSVFQVLDTKFNSDADDVAMIYVNAIRPDGAVRQALKSDRTLVDLLVRRLSKTGGSTDKRDAAEFLKTL